MPRVVTLRKSSLNTAVYRSYTLAENQEPGRERLSLSLEMAHWLGTKIIDINKAWWCEVITNKLDFKVEQQASAVHVVAGK